MHFWDTPNLHFEWLSHQISKQGIFGSLHIIQLLNILTIYSMFQETILQRFQMPFWIPNVLLTNEHTNSAWNINASPVTSSSFHFIIADKLPDKGRRHHTSVNISPRYVHIWNVTGNYSGANTILFTWISSIDSTSFLLFNSLCRHIALLKRYILRICREQGQDCPFNYVVYIELFLHF